MFRFGDNILGCYFRDYRHQPPSILDKWQMPRRFENMHMSVFGHDMGHRRLHRDHHSLPHLHHDYLGMAARIVGHHVLECQDLISKKKIRVKQNRILRDVVGAFNQAIVLCEEVGTRRKLIQKQFRPQDLPRIFHAETKTMRALRHCRYTVKMVASADHTHRRPPSAWVLLEYCNLGTLADLLQAHVTHRRPFLESFVVRVLFCLVEAISYMQNGDVKPGHTDQSRGWILHGDIHPGNVFLKTAPRASNKFDVLLGDFGSSRHFGSWQDEPSVGGDAAQHPYYLVPDATWNRRADVYQIGLIMVDLCRLTLKPLEEAKCGGLACGRRYSSKLNELVGKCLRSHPQNRIRVAELREVLHSQRMTGSALFGSQFLLFKEPS